MSGQIQTSFFTAVQISEPQKTDVPSSITHSFKRPLNGTGTSIKEILLISAFLQLSDL